MEFRIKQNGNFISLSSFDEQYCLFTGEELRFDVYGRWFNYLEFVFNIWGDIADNTNKEYSYLRKQMNIKDSRIIPAKDSAHCLMLWAALRSVDMDDILHTLRVLNPIVEFFNSLDDTTFYFTF